MQRHLDCVLSGYSAAVVFLACCSLQQHLERGGHRMLWCDFCLVHNMIETGSPSVGPERIHDFPVLLFILKCICVSSYMN